MSIQELLADRGLTTALIVDDGYDQVPRAWDIADEEAWATFFADITPELPAVIAAFSAYESMSAHELRHSDEFVAALWGAKASLSPVLWNTLFDTYVQATEGDRRFLEGLEGRLGALGIKLIRSGRTLPSGAEEAKLIFADLFLGAAQQPDDADRSVQSIQQLLRGRESEPPLVILMSRSNVLNDRKQEFRDKAKLLGAMFRVSSKGDLLQDENLEKILRRLAQHLPDAVRVAEFLRSWELGLDSAKERFLTGVRRLDLSDYAQIKEVLLNFEGQPLGSYLLDVFDRVLQHEIEGDEKTIVSAENLNQIDTESYPVPYVASSPDLQDLVYRAIWQNPKRLQVRTTECDIPVGFGDVLVRKQVTQGSPAEVNAESSATAVGPEQCQTATTAITPPPDVLVVMTPACDLTRKKGANRILLLAGQRNALTYKGWNYKEDGLRTPIIKLSDERRQSIKWDSKDLQLVLPSEIRKMVEEEGTHEVVLRLRESNALELQQRLLSNMGRVGLLAQMPATFPVVVEALYLDASGNQARFSTPILDKEGGVCFTGRDADGDPRSRLVLTDQAIDELLTVISKLTERSVSQSVRDTLRRLQASRAFVTDLQRGLEVSPSGASYKTIQCAMDGQPERKDIVGLIVRNPNPTARPEPRHSALILILKDIEQV